MKINKKFEFWDAERLTKNLIYGTKKAYDFTLALRSHVQDGYVPTGWYGIKLINVFNSTLPNLLVIGYWDGGELSCTQLNTSVSMAEYELAILAAVKEYFKECETTEVYVEAYT